MQEVSYALSRIPESSQQGVHEQLSAVVERHLAAPFRKPIASYNQAAFEALLERWDGRTPLILDAGCGVGWSTLTLARRHPEAFVVGVDQSAERLARRKPLPPALWPENLLFLRADLVDFWRFLAEAGVRLAEHWWFYPNPWPKIGHLKRRWYAHPVWPTVLRLGGRFECRTNWRIYADELVAALAVSGWGAEVAPFAPEGEALTPFERKYRDSGQVLYQVVCDFRGAPEARGASAQKEGACEKK